MNSYTPPYAISDNMLNRVASIISKLDKIDNYSFLSKRPYLRKVSKISSIHSSLAIENNNLSFNQVKDVIDGKTVFGSKKDIQEVKNAYEAYDMILDVNPFSLKDLKKIHEVIGKYIIEDAGEFRKGNEGVFDGDNCIFIAPKPEMVEGLMNSLFDWMKNNKDKVNPLIMSSIFHYEFVFIHPFTDGNGRMARLWQNIILSNWNETFLYVPIESYIYKYQEEYYKVINDCNVAGNSDAFIEFMLKMIDECLDEVVVSSSRAINEEDINMVKLLEVLGNDALSANEIMERIGIKSKKTLKARYLDRALELGLVAMTVPDKKNSSNQKYVKL